MNKKTVRSISVTAVLVVLAVAGIIFKPGWNQPYSPGVYQVKKIDRHEVMLEVPDFARQLKEEYPSFGSNQITKPREYFDPVNWGRLTEGSYVFFYQTQTSDVTAAEVTKDAKMARAYAHIPSFREPSNFYTWIADPVHYKEKD